MKRALVALFLIGLAAAPTATAAPLIPRDLTALGAYDHALVQLDRDHGAAAEARLRAAGGVLVSERLRLWRLPSTAARQLVPELAVTGAVTDVEPDYPHFREPAAVSVDPFVDREWWLSHVGADSVQPPGPGKPVTVVDSGLDTTHEEFAGRPDTLALNLQTTVGRDEFHGTAVSSVIGAPENGVGIVGIYPQAVLRSWDASPGSFLSSSEVIQGIETAASLGAGVINLSLGSQSFSRFESNAILDAFARGSIVVAASGNDGESGSPLSYPANATHVVTVGSTDEADRVSTFSSRTRAMDLGAPGESIPAAIPTAFAASGYAAVDGTSFSAPIVSGALAWIWTARPELDNTQVMELARRTARDVGTPGKDSQTGFGIIDIPAALTAPAPGRDPLEPNDRLDQVTAGELFAKAEAPLTAPGRRSASISARLDVPDDPRDLYRIWAPARSRVTATLRSTTDIDLAPQGSRPRTLAVKTERSATGLRVVSVTNSAARGVFMYLGASLRTDTNPSYASYTLRLTTAATPKR